MLETASVSSSYGTMKATTPTVSEVRTSQVRAQMEDQANLIEQLQDCVSMVTQRLGAVCLQPEAYDNSGMVEVLLVPLADEVRNNNRRIDGIRAQLADLTQRIEL